MHAANDVYARLLFGNANATVETNFQTLAGQFSGAAPAADFDCVPGAGFFYKGSVLALDELVFFHSIARNFIASSQGGQYILSIVLNGESSVHHGNHLYTLNPREALLVPPGIKVRRSIRSDLLATNLCIGFDLIRLNRVSLAMQGGEGVPITEMHLHSVKLQYGPINLRHLFIQFIEQVDALGGDAVLLKAAGFDDQVYRFLALALQPEVFLHRHVSAEEQRTLEGSKVTANFEAYVDAHLQDSLRLTEIELALGVSARALQYACRKRHGCSPSTYIRNRRLDIAYEVLEKGGPDLRVAALAADYHFSSQSHFSRYFRERFGVLPSEVLKPKQKVNAGGILSVQGVANDRR